MDLLGPAMFVRYIRNPFMHIPKIVCYAYNTDLVLYIYNRDRVRYEKKQRLIWNNLFTV